MTKEHNRAEYKIETPSRYRREKKSTGTAQDYAHRKTRLNAVFRNKNTDKDELYDSSILGAGRKLSEKTEQIPAISDIPETDETENTEENTWPYKGANLLSSYKNWKLSDFKVAQAKRKKPDHDHDDCNDDDDTPKFATVRAKKFDTKTMKTVEKVILIISRSTNQTEIMIDAEVWEKIK